MTGFAPSLVALGLVAAAAAIQSRRFGVVRVRRLPAASKALVVATAAQCLHFIEEWATGFATRFPALFGLEPVPETCFVSFNLAWIAAWAASVFLLRTGHGAALFAAWFLAFAAMLNGVAHPLLAAAAGGYFPGLITSPIIGLLGLRLYRRLGELAEPASTAGKRGNTS